MCFTPTGCPAWGSDGWVRITPVCPFSSSTSGYHAPSMCLMVMLQGIIVELQLSPISITPTTIPNKHTLQVAGQHGFQTNCLHCSSHPLHHHNAERARHTCCVSAVPREDLEPPPFLPDLLLPSCFSKETRSCLWRVAQRYHWGHWKDGRPALWKPSCILSAAAGRGM